MPKKHGIEVKRRYVEYLLSPFRSQRSLGEFAAEIGVHRDTLTGWNQDPEVLALLLRWREMYEPVWAAAIGTLGSVATDRDHPQVIQGIRTMAELMDKFPDKRVKVELDIHAFIGGARQVEPMELEAEEIKALPEPGRNGDSA